MAALAADSPFDTGRALQAQGDYVGAERAYRDFLKQHPRSVPALTNLGVVIARQDRLAEAVAAYQSALAVDGESLPARTNLALAYYRMGAWLDAARWLKSVLKTTPGDRRALQLLAIASIQSRQYAAAAAAYEQLMPSDDPSVAIGLSVAYRETGRREESDRLLDAVLSRHGQTPEVQSLLGLAAYARKDYPRAASAFEEMIRLAPQNPDGHFYLGVIYFEQHEFAEAAESWKRAIQADSRHFPAIFSLGALLAGRGEYADAKPLLLRAISLRPHQPAVQLELGRLCLHEGNVRESLHYLKAAAGLDPNSKQASYLLAGAYRKLGLAGDAAAEFRRYQKLRETGIENEWLTQAVVASREDNQ
jgi:tetratricopeptide (TPR) repeat protein